MPQTFGPHLLGRIPSPPDERDFRLENFLSLGSVDAGTTDPVQLASLAISELKQTTSTYKKWAATPYTDIQATHWWKALNALQQITNPTPAPSPTPTPAPTGNVIWTDAEQLDQGDFGTCVGNGWAQWGNTLPVDDKFTEGMGQSALTGGPFARAIYYEATVLDGAPDNPDASGGGQQGATVRSGAKAMQNRKRSSTYVKATTIDAIKTWLQTKGPVVVGSNWTADMFNPDANGYIKPTGAVEGGHCWLIVGDLEDESAFYCQNSWGTGWGLNGYFKIKWADFQTLLSQGGEAWTALELALA